MNERMTARRIRITGIVQGVGFRPHVYRLARELDLKGWVLNSSAGVLIEVEGPERSTAEFCRRVVEEPPPLAVIRSCEVQEIPWQGFPDFTIRESASEDERDVMISPDIAICEDCKREITDPADRRYRYPFTNCTNCGPRFTIIRDVPYDRDKTTMAPFVMCHRCREEYEDPLNRRFHAQPNACPECGPRLRLVNSRGEELACDVRELLKKGEIVAVKGLGAFHLAADATNPETVALLRRRKKRESKPFAVMARDIDTARKYCRINEVEAAWLTSPQAPIVILERKMEVPLPDGVIHPGIDTLGVMLPYTPLHYLLFDDDLELLIMTSANISDEPLIIDNDEALRLLSDIADAFLLHNREILNPCDDSVLRVTPAGRTQMVRRARGFVPRGIHVPLATRPVLAVGGEMKNTFCLTRGGEAFLSQHWGDMSHFKNYQKFLEALPRFKKMLAVEPEIIAHDLHPDYQTTRWALQQQGFVRVAVQHHHAHMASCMAENGLTGEVLGLICDGTGWGTDGAVWGGEVLCGGYREFSRLGHLRYVPLPGGDLTVRKPYRMAFVYLWEALGEQAVDIAGRFLPDLGPDERALLITQIKRGPGSVPTSSCGRLFDAVSAFLGICTVNRYEGQAAAELEAAAGKLADRPYKYEVRKENGVWVMDVLPMWKQLVRDMELGEPVPHMAARFHRTLVCMMLEVLDQVGKETGLNRVVLSGGVFHNQLLLVELRQLLEAKGYTVYEQCLIPPGDGGISLGQALVASEVKF